jgi:hypothetical protein
MSRNTLALMALPIALLTGCETGTPTEPAPVPAVVAPQFSTGALIRTEDVGGPFYARINPMPPYIFADGGWVGIAFYRSPGCVPGDFNLLEFFDLTEAFPFGPPRPILCQLMVHGHTLWRGAPMVGAPHTVVSQGNGAVPVWFALETQVLAAMGDNVLTILELEALPSLIKGEASHFNELLHPHSMPGPNGGGHPVPKIVLNAHGTLDDGRSFQFHINSVDRGARNIRIRFQ